MSDLMNEPQWYLLARLLGETDPHAWRVVEGPFASHAVAILRLSERRLADEETTLIDIRWPAEVMDELKQRRLKSEAAP
jgi:hypothetical protein